MGVQEGQESTGILSSVNRRLLLVGILAVSVAVMFAAGFYFTGSVGDDQSGPPPAVVVSSAHAVSPRLSLERASATSQADPPDGATIDLGRITNTPVSIGHIPLDVQAVLLARLASGLSTSHYAVVKANADAFFDSPTPSHAGLQLIFDHTMLTLLLSRTGDQKKETYRNVTEEMLRMSKNFDDIIKLGATADGDATTEAQYQASLSSFAAANGYSLLPGWAPCAPSADLAVEVVINDPREQLSAMGFSQDAVKDGGDTSGGLVEAKQIPGAYLVYYHRLNK